MQRVRRLVRLDPDQRRLHLVDRAVERLEVDAAELRREDPLHLRVRPAPPLDAAPDEVLEHPALRLVQRERGPAAERRALERRVDVVLVQAMAALVHRGEDPSHLARRVVRRHPDVRGRHRRRERVRDRVEAPAPFAEAEALEEHHLHLPLPLDREVAEETRVVDLLRRRARRPAARAPRAARVKTSRTSCVFMPGSKSSSSASYGSSTSKQDAYSRRSAMLRSRYGRKSSKSFFARASTQTGNASAPARVCASRSSAGTRNSLSRSRRVTRIRLASSES